MKKVTSMFLAMAVVFGMGFSQSRAAETRPIAALAVASYNDLVSDVNFVGNLIQRPQLGAVLDGGVAFITQLKGLVGVDKTRRWGAVVQASGEDDVSAYLFVPVTDFKQALSLVELYCTVESEGGVYKLTPKDGKKVGYLKQQGAWAFLADKAEALAKCDADPSALLGNLKNDYIVGARVFLANVPEGLRQKFLSQLKQGLQKDAAQHADESNEEYASRKKIIDQVEPYLTRVFSDLDQIVFGWGLDRTAEKTFVDLSVTARPGTKTAEEMGLAAKSTTNFAGFRLPNATATAAWAGTMPAAKQEIAASLIEFVRGKGLAGIEKKTPENKRAVAREVFNDGADLLQKIVKSGHVDGVDTAVFGPDGATGLVAVYVADGALLDKILHAVAKGIIAEHPEVAQFVKLDAEKSGSINFHKISVPVPKDAKDRETAVKLIGEKFDFVVGVGQENAYVAIGRDADTTLKKAIAASSQMGPKSVSPLEVSFAVEPVAAFVATAGKVPDRQNAAMVERELKKTPGKDHVIFTVRPIANGVQVHLEIEQGLVRLFGRLVVMGLEHKTAAAPE